MNEVDKCCDNCDYYQGALCVIWIEDDTECIEEIECPEVQVCVNWDGRID